MDTWDWNSAVRSSSDTKFTTLGAEQTIVTDESKHVETLIESVFDFRSFGTEA